MVTTRPITPYDRKRIETALADAGYYGYYFNFPVIFSMSQTAESPFLIKDTGISPIFVSPDVLYCPAPRYAFLSSPSDLNGYKVMMSYSKLDNVTSPHYDADITLFDREYVYDLNTTLNVKNFRDNAQRFIGDNPAVTVECLQSSNQLEAIEMLKQWYSKHSGALQDFGQTVYTLEHFSELGLTGFVFYLRDEVKGVSLFRNDILRAIHITSKDMGQPFLQDYMRYYTYEKLSRAGVRTVYDGSDCDQPGLATYKLKLRPTLIIPIYTVTPKRRESPSTEVAP